MIRSASIHQSTASSFVGCSQKRWFSLRTRLSSRRVAFRPCRVLVSRRCPCLPSSRCAATSILQPAALQPSICSSLSGVRVAYFRFVFGALPSHVYLLRRANSVPSAQTVHPFTLIRQYCGRSTATTQKELNEAMLGQNREFQFNPRDSLVVPFLLRCFCWLCHSA
jgi:hypothetical protein